MDSIPATSKSEQAMPEQAMPLLPPAWRKLPLIGGWVGGRIAALMVVAGVVIAGVTLAVVVLGVAPIPSALAASGAPPALYRCDGDPLEALLVSGAVDDPTIPDPSSGPVPVGGVVVLQWHELRLQLPRTNNAGPASFTDGKWWWSLEDPAHPRFRLRRGQGEVQDIACEPAP
jgi:hypothetical protein